MAVAAPHRALTRIEGVFSTAFGARCNPFHHLGALTIFFFWIVLLSGIYLLLFFEFSVYGAYHSVERLTYEQWYLGGVMRSLHRYASDAAVVTMMLHLAREFLLGRFRGARWYTWFTGVPLLWLVFFLGITGYWLVWDELAQYVAIGTSLLLDWLPVFGEPMVRNFLTPESLGDRFFTLMAFLHMVGTPVMLIFGVWFHILRLARPVVTPPRALVLGSLAALLLLSLWKPAVSHEFADLTRVPTELNIDWFYLGVFPLLDVTSPGVVWLLLTAVTLALAALPGLGGRRRDPAAEVDLAHCNGCGRCALDCPYGAITLASRNDGRDFKQRAVVDPALCTACGICVGACPSSTPFRRVEQLVTGIDLPQFSLHQLRETTRAALASVRHPTPLLVYGCAHSVDVEDLDLPGTAGVNLPCIAMLPPPVIDYALRQHGTAGVVVTGCAACDCYYRLGNRWMEERIDGQREPRLRERVERERLITVWVTPAERDRLIEAIRAFQARLHAVRSGVEEGVCVSADPAG
jgi:ferredoxin/coenzyme F420-reducing hydrogenase delta subunit